MLKTIADFVSNNFDTIILVYISVLLLCILGLLVSNAKNSQFINRITSGVSNFFVMLFVVGQIFLVLLICYTVWSNYIQSIKEFRFPRDALVHTQWVKSDSRIYFINGTVLSSIQINGNDLREVFKADEDIHEYHFSPNGQKILVVTQKALYLADLNTKEKTLIASLKDDELDGELSGVINSVIWAPDNEKFCYEITQWSSYFTQTDLYIYNLVDGSTQSAPRLPRRTSPLYWDILSENLYSLHREALDTSENAYPFKIKVVRLPVSTLKPIFVVDIPFELAKTPLENLDLRDINLFFYNKNLAFGRIAHEDSLESEHGAKIGVDDKDNLYLIKNKWFRKRLFRIPRKEIISDLSRHQYRGGELVIDYMGWIPGGRYVILEHRDYGIFVLEPFTGKVGVLSQAIGSGFGWYSKPLQDYLLN